MGWFRVELHTLLVCLYICSIWCSTVERRQTGSPAPIAFDPDENWEGIDGSWNTFTLRLGNPIQTVRVFISWMNYQTWVVAPQGCQSGANASSCENARGGIFDFTSSNNWDYVGLYAFSIEENLGLSGNAYFGYDNVSLGGLGQGGPMLRNTTVGAYAVDNYYLGYFGVNPKPTNWSSLENGAPSYMTQLKSVNLIPSVSFGYTAGAPYRFTSVLGSLTLGGFDASRFEPNDVEFTFAPDSSRDTVVAIQTITTTNANDSSITVELLSTAVYALVDATVAEIWLPVEACEAFEREFGLVYDSNTELYLVNDTLHAQLLERGANITFALAQGTSGGDTAVITLPYSSFDLTAQSPYQGLGNTSHYFPLRRAQNDTQYTLGRTFMQEAYITVDYERAKFNLSQTSWVQDVQANIIAIPPASRAENSNYSGAGYADTTPSNSTTAASSGLSHSNGISGGAIGGIVAGVVLGILAGAGATIWYFRRKRAQKMAFTDGEKGSSHSSHDSVTAVSTGSRSAGGDGESSGRVSGRDGEPIIEHYAPDNKGTTVFPKSELEGSNSFPLPPPPDAKSLLHPPDSPSSNSPSTPTTPGYDSYDSRTSAVTHNSAISPLSPTGTSEAAGDMIFEMPGDMPEVSQADGRQISEKQLMRRREEQINGVDPRASDEAVDGGGGGGGGAEAGSDADNVPHALVSPLLEQQPVRDHQPRAVVQPADVVLQDEVREGYTPDAARHRRFSFEDGDASDDYDWSAGADADDSVSIQWGIAR